MKFFRVHPMSILVGALAVGSGLSLLGMAQVVSAPTPNAPHLAPIPIGRTITVHGIPTPKQMMRVVEGSPYAVPNGKLFVVTGIGSTENNNSTPNIRITVRFDDVPVIAAYAMETLSLTNSLSGGGPAIPMIPPGLVANGGTVVSVDDALPGADNVGVLLGYLADA